MKKLFLIVLAVTLLTFMGCNPITSSGNGFDNLVRIKNFDKYTALGVGNKNTARSARSLTTDYFTSCGLFGQNPDGTYELLIFEDSEGHEVDQSYYLKNFCDSDTFVFISFTVRDEGFYTEFGTGDYTYCVNKEDGKMYNIGDKFINNVKLIGTSHYNSYVKSDDKLSRLSFENDLLKIEEIFDFTSVHIYIKDGCVDKFGTYANNYFYINKDDTEITRFDENVEIKLGFNDRIYIGYEGYYWFDNGEITTAVFIPDLFTRPRYKISYDEEYYIIKSFENIYIYSDNIRDVIITLDGDAYTEETFYDDHYIVDRFVFYVDYTDKNLVKYDFYNKEEIERYEFINCYLYNNTFTATDSDWNYIKGYIDSKGDVHLDLIEYENESNKITFISSLN